MHREIDTKDSIAVRNEVEALYQATFPEAKQGFTGSAFDTVVQCFSGRYADYQPIDVRYHDLEHTLQGTLCLARLLHGYARAAAEPILTQPMFELGLWAILLHDTGYLKVKGDREGTGAKYTLTHVARSVELAGRILSEQKFSPREIKSVQNMIRCTGVNADLGSIPFSSDLERKIGFALGTSDLLGQMAAPDYVAKLGILYEEFAESARFQGKAGPFSSFEDLRQKTPAFWEKYVLPKVNNDFLGLHRYLADPPSERNSYIVRIEENIRQLREQLAAESSS